MKQPRKRSSDYSPGVRAQYEDYPFPLRNPQDETSRLLVTEQDCLAKLNHYCFGGRQSFLNGFRVLVAGGGTGDHTIFLAEQLRNYDANVTYIDISSSSMKIAVERARIRGLNNIEWHNCSILDIPSLNFAPFDLISCTGVLHHMLEPERGLAALRSVLAQNGAMSLMLYGRTGRMGVYIGQELLRLVNEGVDDPKSKTRHAKAMVQSMPRSNWLFRGNDWEKLLKEYVDDESNLNDVLLHKQDRAYSVLEIYELLAGAELELIEFTSFFTNMPIRRSMYDPMTWIRDPALREHIRRMPLPKQQAIAEYISCALTCHGFYAAPEAAGRIASPEDRDSVPFFLYFDPAALITHLRSAVGKSIKLEYRNNAIEFAVGKHSGDLLAGINGSRSVGELLELVCLQSVGSASEAEIHQDFMALYRPLNILDTLLLRHPSVQPFREYALDGNQ